MEAVLVYEITTGSIASFLNIFGWLGFSELFVSLWRFVFHETTPKLDVGVNLPYL